MTKKRIIETNFEDEKAQMRFKAIVENLWSEKSRLKKKSKETISYRILSVVLFLISGVLLFLLFKPEPIQENLSNYRTEKEIFFSVYPEYSKDLCLAQFASRREAESFILSISEFHEIKLKIITDSLGKISMDACIQSPGTYSIALGAFRRDILGNYRQNLVHLSDHLEDSIHKYRIGPFVNEKEANIFLERNQFKTRYLIEY